MRKLRPTCSRPAAPTRSIRRSRGILGQDLGVGEEAAVKMIENRHLLGRDHSGQKLAERQGFGGSCLNQIRYLVELRWWRRLPMTLSVTYATDFIKPTSFSSVSDHCLTARTLDRNW
jgi:hypothetical protein